MYNIFLEYNNGFKWFCNEKLWVKGYFFTPNGKYYTGDDILLYFSDIVDFNTISKMLKQLNGVFSLVAVKEDSLFVYSDKTRFFTLFYTFYNNSICLSDSVDKLINNTTKPTIDKNAEKEFSGMGYVGFDQTLYNNIYQVKASEIIEFDKRNIISRKQLFEYSTISYFDTNFDGLFQEGNKVICRGFDRMLESVKGRQLVVPLSGGYDSRFIVTFLKSRGVENVVCFTYGKKDHPEVSISRKVAERLGYKWYFMDHEKVSPLKPENNIQLLEYVKYAGQCSSMFFLSEYFSLEYLKNSNLIDENAVFIPGHSGDVIGGSQYIKVYDDKLTYDNIFKFFVSKKYVNKKLTRKTRFSIIDKYKSKYSIEKYKAEGYDVRSVFEDIDMKERLSKFIFNSSKVFVYFGYECRFPFWDDEIMRFFKLVPYKLKRKKILYDSIFVNLFFEKFNVDFKKELQPNIFDLKLQKIKQLIKQLFPRKMKYKYVVKNDWINYLPLTIEMQNELKSKVVDFDKYPYSVNSILIEWQLLKAKEKAGL